jgi:hypothetical protein
MSAFLRFIVTAYGVACAVETIWRLTYGRMFPPGWRDA